MACARCGLEYRQTRVLIGPPEEYVHGHTLPIMLTQIIRCVWVYKRPPRFPNFRHRSVARSYGRRATPSCKISCPGGNRAPIARELARGRYHPTTTVSPCQSGDGSGYSHPRYHVALSQRGLKANTSSKAVSTDDRRVIATGNVRRVDHESSRRFVTRHDLD